VPLHEDGKRRLGLRTRSGEKPFQQAMIIDISNCPELEQHRELVVSNVR
jgi:hypothetical protein